MSCKPILKVAGSHFDCGYQVGRQCADQINSILEFSRNEPPNNLTWQECIEKSKPYLEITNFHYPFAVEEIMGASKGAGVSFDDLFLNFIEEFWSDSDATSRQCTDIVVCPPLTNGDVVVGHNNDLTNIYLENITVVDWTFDTGDKLLTIGPAGIYPSVGVNSHGICLSGNELSPNDEKFGIPRSIIARAILNQKTFEKALTVATSPLRASSYNNIIATKDVNEVVSMEGSATDCELIYPKDGFLVHSNHYLADKMRKFETPDDFTSSRSRQKRGEEVVRWYKDSGGNEIMKTILCDHGEDSVPCNNTICRHSPNNTTVFSFIANMTKGFVEYSIGHPCASGYTKVWEF